MTSIKIRGYHCDAYGHVNNARILEFYEESRWDFLEQNNRIQYFTDRNLLFFIVNINVDYKISLTPNMVVSIKTSFLERGNTSITLLQEMYLNDALAGKAQVKFVLFNSKTNRPEKVSDAFCEQFK